MLARKSLTLWFFLESIQTGTRWPLRRNRTVSRGLPVEIVICTGRHPACVISIDLDGLKLINDTEGHSAGDDLIRRAAQAIRTVIRDQDIVARVGGDEFLVLGVECDADGSQALLERIMIALYTVQVDASVGLALRNPSRGLSHAVHEADKSMYLCKDEHRNSRRQAADWIPLLDDNLCLTHASLNEFLATNQN